MNNNLAVRKVAKFIFDEHFTKTTAPDSSDEAYIVTKEFSQKLGYVIKARLPILISRWTSCFDKDISRILSSHESYLRYTFFTCFSEHAFNPKIFDSFVSVCLVVGYLNNKTLRATGLNFRDWNCDIVMEFYKSVMKKTFRCGGGFQRFVEFILNHRYLRWKLNKLDLHDVPTNFYHLTEADTYKNEVTLELNHFQKKSEGNSKKWPARSLSLAQNFLSNISVELPTLPSYPDLIRKLVAIRQKEKIEIAEVKRKIEAALKIEPLEEVLERCSNSDPNIRQTVEQKEDISEYENIIESVIRYNHSKSSGLVTSDNHILKEAEEILGHLEDTIQSLIEVLDEYDKE